MPEPEKKRWQGAYAAPERVFRIPQAYFLQKNRAGKIYRLSAARRMKRYAWARREPVPAQHKECVRMLLGAGDARAAAPGLQSLTRKNPQGLSLRRPSWKKLRKISLS